MSAQTDELLERLLSEVETLKTSVARLQEDQNVLLGRFDTEQARIGKLQRSAEKLVTQTKKLVAGVEALISSS